MNLSPKEKKNETAIDIEKILSAPEPNLQLADPALVNFYNDLENRIYWISDIDESLYCLVQYIIQWNREDKDLSITDRKPIKLFFASIGGSLEIYESLVSIIEISKTPIYGYAMGCVASAASCIYLSCHKRFALPNAYLIVHKGSCSIEGNYDEVLEFMINYQSQIDNMEQFYIKHTSYTPEEIHENINSDWYIKGEELLEKGLVHEMITDINVLL